MKRFAAAAWLLALLSVPCAAGLTPDSAASEAPFSFEKGHVLVQAKIKSDVPVEVILSTGSEHSLIDSALLRKYKLPAYYSAEAPITGRNDRLYSFSTVPEVRVGGVKETSLSMRFGSMADVSSRVGREVFGILGVDFFKGRVVQFDFAKKVVRFLPQSPPDALKGAGPAGGAATRIVLPMRFYKERVTLPIIDDVAFDGKKIKTLLDTGTVTVVSLSSSAGKQLGLSPLPEKAAPRADKVGTLLLDAYEIKDVPVLLFARGSQFDRDQKEFGAVAGSILLQNFAVTFDFNKKVVILERP